MRFYMVDPDNEERLLKVPPHVVKRIKAEAYAEAVEAVRALSMNRPTIKESVVAAIEALSTNSAFDLNTTNKDAE